MVKSIRDGVLEVLRRREDRIQRRGEYRAQIDAGLYSEDVNFDNDTSGAQYQLEAAAKFVQEVAWICGDVELAGIAAMALMDVEAAEEREAWKEVDRRGERKADWAFFNAVARAVDDFLVGFILDLSQLHALVDEKTPPQVDPTLVESLHKYIDHGGRSRSLRDVMVRSLVAKLKPAGMVPTTDDLKAAATDALPDLHRSMRSYLVKKLTRVIAENLVSG